MGLLSEEVVRGGALAVVTTAVACAWVADSGQDVSPPARPVAVVAIVVVMVAAGVGSAGLIRLVAARRARAGQWLRRYSACLVLMVPAATLVMWPFPASSDAVAGEWPRNCGNLVARTAMAGCGSLAHDRLLLVVAWVVVGILVPAGYGVSLRWRGSARLEDVQQGGG